jgi:hypothetical protein
MGLKPGITQDSPQQETESGPVISGHRRSPRFSVGTSSTRILGPPHHGGWAAQWIENLKLGWPGPQCAWAGSASFWNRDNGVNEDRGIDRAWPNSCDTVPRASKIAWQAELESGLRCPSWEPRLWNESSAWWRNVPLPGIGPWDHGLDVLARSGRGCWWRLSPSACARSP